MGGHKLRGTFRCCCPRRRFLASRAVWRWPRRINGRPVRIVRGLAEQPCARAFLGMDVSTLKRF
eukprot:1459947-Pyramimonas_sp.AAC.1